MADIFGGSPPTLTPLRKGEGFGRASEGIAELRGRGPPPLAPPRKGKGNPGGAGAEVEPPTESSLIRRHQPQHPAAGSIGGQPERTSPPERTSRMRSPRSLSNSSSPTTRSPSRTSRCQGLPAQRTDEQVALPLREQAARRTPCPRVRSGIPVIDRLLHAGLGRSLADLQPVIVEAVGDHRPTVVAAA